MFEGLDAIDWASLSHAYGSASDVPDLLRLLLSEDQQIREDALIELFGNIHHQGTIYEASSYAIPFLVELMNCPAFSGKDDIAMLIICIAAGRGYYEVHATGERRKEWEEILAQKNQSLDEAIHREAKYIRRLREVASPYIPRLLSYLQHKDSELRLSVSEMLPCYPEYFETTISALENALVIETDDEVKEYMQGALDIMKAKDSTF